MWRRAMRGSKSPGGGLSLARVRVYVLRRNAHRFENSKWTLEVIDSAGTSTVWDDQFDTDEEAKAEFNRCIAEEGIVSLTPVRN